MAATPKENFQYYLAHQDELVKDYNGKYLVIYDRVVVGAYSSEMEALQQGKKAYELGTFIVQKCEPGTESYVQTFHSRVRFAA